MEKLASRVLDSSAQQDRAQRRATIESKLRAQAEDAARQQALHLKSPHIVGLFCPYSRSLLTLVWSTQAQKQHWQSVAAEEEESMREQEGKTELDMERGRLATLRQSVEEERRLRNVALQTVFV